MEIARVHQSMMGSRMMLSNIIGAIQTTLSSLCGDIAHAFQRTHCEMFFWGW